MEKIFSIRSFKESDYAACARIYQEGLDTGIASFENSAPSWQIWDDKYLSSCRFVAVSEGVILGWIALTPFSSRAVYKGVAEISLYIAKKERGRKIGKALLKHIVNVSSSKGFWTLQAKIFPQNVTSIELFVKCGFRKVGVREKIAQRDGIWQDNILMEYRNTNI